MYQLEVKFNLVQLAFNPANGWRVTVHVDPMERARGGSHPADKAERAHAALKRLELLGARLGTHDRALHVRTRRNLATQRAFPTALPSSTEDSIELRPSASRRGPIVARGLGVGRRPVRRHEARHRAEGRRRGVL